jgi:SAM-dependent methyltransferase
MNKLDRETEIAHQDWDDRARKNALHYICSERNDWDLESFFRSGEADYDSLAAPFLSKLGFATETMSMIELGCGVGRVTRSFARRFASVTALDVSEEMLERGRGLHKDFDNIVWTKGDGKTFSGVESSSMHFAFSYLVLQHIPSKELVLRYVREMMRVLKPGGAFCFQFNSCTYPTMNWKGRLLWRLVDESVEANRSSWVRNGGRKIASIIGVDGLAAGRTWRGAVLDPREILETVWESGGLVHAIRDWGAPRTWCLGAKSGL